MCRVTVIPKRLSALPCWLGWRFSGEGGNVPECTGAQGSRVLGKIAPGRGFRQMVMNLPGLP